MKWIIFYISGYSQLKVVSTNFGRFISECAKAGIYLKDIKRTDSITLYVKVANKDLNQICDISRNTNTEYQIINTYGLKRLLQNVRKRKFFVLGFVLFVFLIVLSSSFITDITVMGNNKLSENQIIDMLGKSGFKKGMFAHNIDKKQIQKDILKKNNQLTWLWIEVKGTCAVVTVRERIPKPEIKDDTDYSNCVASNDGQIIEVMPRYGKQMVFPGDVVQKGDLLISGISETKADNIRYIHADGIVMAKTWYSISGEYHHIRCDRYLTGNSKKRYNINIFGNSFPLSIGKDLYDKYDKQDNVKNLCDFLNLSFTISTYYEIIEKNVEISDDEVINTAIVALEDELHHSLKDKKDLTVNNVTYEYYKNQSGNIEVSVYFECIENIAQYQPIYKPEQFTEDIDGKNSDV